MSHAALQSVKNISLMAISLIPLPLGSMQHSIATNIESSCYCIIQYWLAFALSFYLH